MADDKAERIVRARLALRERFLDRMRLTPAQSDARPRGTLGPNAHGMPQLPVGQTITQGWPVLDLGQHPDVPTDRFELAVDGEVEAPLRLDWKAFLALPQVADVSDFHCVTAWSKLGVLWVGVQVSTVLALARPTPKAAFLACHASDGYSTNLPLEEALKDDVLLVHKANGIPLPREHGGPVRMITPQLYAWKGAKWIRRLEVTAEDHPGFWERRGYSNTAHPWRNDRYS